MTTRRRVKIENIRWFFTRFFPLFWCIFLWCRCRCGGGAGWRPPVVSVRFVCQRWRPRVPQFAFNFTIFSDLWPSKAIFLHYFSAVSADCAEIYGGGFFFFEFLLTLYENSSVIRWRRAQIISPFCSVLIDSFQSLHSCFGYCSTRCKFP